MDRCGSKYGNEVKIGTFILVCLSISFSLFLMVSSIESAQKSPQSSIQKPTLLSNELSSPLEDIASSIKNILSELKKKNKYPPWLITFGPWFTGVVALFLAFVLNFIIPWWRKPKLKAKFENDKIEYAMKLFFDPLSPPLIDPLLSNETIFLRQPGFNSRVKIINDGRSVAKNVQARLESIKYKEISTRLPPEIYYHPSTVKWSGEKEYTKVDIAPFGSYFFLDLVYSINESYSEVLNYYKDRDDIPLGMIDPQDYSGDVYWAVWVDRSHMRGIPEKYKEEGSFELNYHVIAENCEPISFTACLTWNKSTWNKPEISIM